MTAELNRMIREFVKLSKDDVHEPMSWFSTTTDDEVTL